MLASACPPDQPPPERVSHQCSRDPACPACLTAHLYGAPSLLCQMCAASLTCAQREVHTTIASSGHAARTPSKTRRTLPPQSEAPEGDGDLIAENDVSLIEPEDDAPYRSNLDPEDRQWLDQHPGLSRRPSHPSTVRIPRRQWVPDGYHNQPS